MGDILLYYRRPDPTTWVYLSSFLTIGLYFAFHRFWSIRNLDIILLILLAPGLLMVHEGRRRQLRTLNSMEAAQVLRETGQNENLADPLEIDLDESVNRMRSAPLTLVSAPTQDSPSPNSGTPDADTPDDQPESSGAAESDENGGETGTEPGPEASEPSESSAADEELAGEGKTSDEDAQSIESDSANASAGANDGITPRDLQRLGFVSLFVIQALILIRLMLDPLMTRRPLLEPNLTIGGLNFIGLSLFIFMMANVLNSNPTIQVTQGPELGPGYALMNMLPAIPTRPVSDGLGGASPRSSGEMSPSQARLALIAKVLAILAHMAIVTGIVLIGSRHFGNLRAGFGCAALYLLLPYTAQMTGRVDHAIPAALLLWALLLYRKPFGAGIFLGLAGGLVYYPLFLLPLWFSFYWQRGARRFAIGVVSMLALLMLLLSFAGTESLVDHLRRMFGLFSPYKEASELRGFWALGLNPIWRLPVIVGFVILSVFFAIWPAQKNLGVLISGSAAVMVAAQFWHGYGGGLYIAWFLPLLLLTIFRPNLQDRVATKVVDGPRVSPLTRETRLEVEAA